MKQGIEGQAASNVLVIKVTRNKIASMDRKRISGNCGIPVLCQFRCALFDGIIESIDKKSII